MSSARVRRIGLAAAVLALGVGIWQAGALAGNGPVKKTITAPIYAGKGDCGGPNTAFPVAGKATFTREGKTMTVAYKEIGLDPSTLYYADLEYSNTPGSCSWKDTVVFGPLMTDKKGHAKGTFKATVPAGKSYFIADLTTDFETNWNGTVSVYLPG